MADFGDSVWKITPEGKRQVFAAGLYGASGNAIDNEGNLLQASFYGDSITKIDLGYFDFDQSFGTARKSLRPKSITHVTGTFCHPRPGLDR